MNVDENWRALGKTHALPVEAIEASLQNWEAVSDRFLAKLRAHASGARSSEEDENALFIAVHMFAEKRDVRAYAPLCRELADDIDAVAWLGDAVTETLGAVLVSLYDGDPQPLQSIFEAPNADAAARNSALMALGYLTRAGKALSDEAMRAYLHRIGQTMTDAEDPLVGLAWAQVIAALGYDDLGPDVARAMSKGAVDGDFYDIKAFHADLRTARDDPGGLAVFTQEGVEPFDSTIEALSRWDWGESSDEPRYDPDEETTLDPDTEFGEEAPPLATPVVNPMRHVGRNDPCPCGSGKKYKKCCLAA